MVCKNCGQKMNRDFCIFCGYMKNGSFIQKERKEICNLLEIYLERDYHKVIRNETYFTTFLLGPLYLCYRKFFLTGFLLEILNVIIYIIVSYIASYLGPFSLLTMITYFFFEKFTWMTIDNMIYLYLLEKKLKKLKEKYKENYKEKIYKMEKKSILSFLIAILLYLLMIVAVIIIYWLYKGRL